MPSKINLCFPDGRRKALTLSYDDGVEQDIKLVELMSKYAVKGTFNLNGNGIAPDGTAYPAGTIHRRMSESQCLSTYDPSLTETACHGYTHPFLEQLPTPEMMRQIIEDRVALENLFGKIIRGMAYPFGTYSDQVIQVMKAAGIVYARTVRSTKKFNLPADWLQWHPTCHHNDPQLSELTQAFLDCTPDGDGILFYLWGHSYEFEGSDNWHVIDTFLRQVSRRKDIWYATNIEIYDYVQAYRRLIFSTDCTRVYNPSAADVWLCYDRDCKICAVPAGESAVL